MTRSAKQWEARIARLHRHTPQDAATLEALRTARQGEAAGDLAEARYLGRLPLGAQGCTEDVEHRALLLWVQRDGLAAFPALRWLHHSPNEAAWRGQAGKGVSAGYSDFLLHVAVGGYRGLALELKAPGGRPSPEQRAWLTHLATQGWRCGLPVGYEAARDALIAYLEGRA